MAGISDILGGPRGIKGFRGTINGAVRSGVSLSDTLAMIRGYYEQQGVKFTAASQQAVTNMYGVFASVESKSQQLARVRGDIGFDSRWVSFATLNRPLQSFNADPRISVRVHATGEFEGLELDTWKTIHFDNEEDRPKSIGELRAALIQAVLDGETEDLSGADVRISEIAAYAV